jgi:hypothetical protein
MFEASMLGTKSGIHHRDYTQTQAQELHEEVQGRLRHMLASSQQAQSTAAGGRPIISRLVDSRRPLAICTPPKTLFALLSPTPLACLYSRAAFWFASCLPAQH